MKSWESKESESEDICQVSGLTHDDSLANKLQKLMSASCLYTPSTHNNTGFQETLKLLGNNEEVSEFNTMLFSQNRL